MMKYTLPTSSPWLVTIDGEQHVTSSAVCRLLLELDQKANAKPVAKKATPKKKE